MASTLARLHDAILRGDADCVAALLRTCGDNVNAIYDQHTAMTRALDAGSDDVIIQHLLAHENFDPNAKNQLCRTALFEASLAGRSEVVESLLRMGAHVDDADRRGVTPLSACAYYNSHHAARVLLAAGADVRSQDCSGDAVLHRACTHGSEEMVTLLLANGQCDVMCRNNNLETPLMLALPSAYNVQVKGQKLSTALSTSRRLLLAGSDVCSLESRCGGTVVHERIRQGDVAGLCLLLDHCPQVADVPDTQGMTPLQLALSRTHGHMKQLAAFLLHYGADPACLMTPSFQVFNPNSTARNAISTAAGGQNSYATEADTIARFYRLQFLRSLLSSIFVTTASVSKLVDLGLVTEDLVQQILQESEDAHMDDATEHGENRVVDNFQAAAESGVRSRSHRNCYADRTKFPQNCAGNFARAPAQFQGRGSPALALTVISSSNSNSSISNSTNNSNTPVQSPVTRIYTFNSYESEVVACVRAALRHSLTLKHQCRLAVRKILHASHPAGLRHLGLPKSLQTYLNLGVDADRGDPFRVVKLHVAVVENDRAALRKLLEDGTHPDAPLRQCTPLTAALAMLPDSDVFPDTTAGVDVTAGNGATGLLDVGTTDDVTGLGDVAGEDDITTQCSSEILARDEPLALDDITAGDDGTGKEVSANEDVTAKRDITTKANVTTSGTLDVLHEGFFAARDTTTQDDTRKLKDDIISLLLRHGASPTQGDPLGDTPLHAAVRRGAFFVHRLLTAVGHVNPVVHAATTGTLHSTCGCINKPVNCTGGCMCKGFKGSDGLTKLIQCALQEKDRLGLTPLQLATLSGDVASARLMLRYWRSDGGGVVPEGGATTGRQQTDQTQILYRYFQKSEVSDDSGITILHSAAAAGAFGVVTHLLTDHGIPPDVKDKLGNTPLYFAVCNGLVSPDMQRAYCSQWGGVKWGHMLSCWPLPPNRQVGEQSRDMEAELACLQLKSGREFSYSRTIQVLLQHGADISTCNLVSKDLLSQVAENEPEQPDVS